jgi:site-specific DNA-cytosine methylase
MHLIKQHHIVGGVGFGQDQTNEPIISGWPCKGLSQAGISQGLLDPKLRLFWELILVLQYL